MGSGELKRTYPIESIVQETESVKTFYFKYNQQAEPGQFLMVWVPGFEEVPMSISFSNKSKIGVSVFNVGDTTKALHKFKVGDYVGIRGPFGTSFKTRGKKVAVVGGGYGSGPLALFCERNPNLKIHALLGARNEGLLLFRERFEKLKYVESHFSTDDGSYGHKGFITEVLEELIKKEKIDLILTVGPELMEKAVYAICKKNNIPVQVSVERLMKCGNGICGSCLVDDKLACKDGPVFSGEIVEKLTEFGKIGRDKAGCKKVYG